MTMPKKRALLLIVILVAGAVAVAPWLTTFFPVPYLPSPSQKAWKHRPGQSLEISVQGPLSVNGLCRVLSTSGRMDIKAAPAKSYPLTVRTTSQSDWGDNLKFDRRNGVTSFAKLTCYIAAVPDDPRLLGTKATVIVNLDVEYPYPAFQKGKTTDEATHFENQKESFERQQEIEFYSPGEYESEQKALAEYEDARAAQRQLPFYRLRTLPSDERLWLRAGCGLLAILVVAAAIWVYRRPAPSPSGES